MNRCEAEDEKVKELVEKTRSYNEKINNTVIGCENIELRMTQIQELAQINGISDSSIIREHLRQSKPALQYILKHKKDKVAGVDYDEEHESADQVLFNFASSPRLKSGYFI